MKSHSALLDRYKKLPVALPSLGDSSSPGDVGRFPKQRMSVVQVIDDSTMLIRLASLPMLLKGVSTEGIADGQTVETDEAYEVVGTESYTSVLTAKRTVLVLKPFDLKRLEEGKP